MKPEETYLQNLRTIERIAAFVARRHHLEASEADEFVQEVRVRLLDDDYAVIRKFEGRSSFSTYLTTVIGRLFTQWRVEQWGKWRPSAEAKRLGDKAITLERLLSRDGFTISEAVRVLTTGSSPYTIGELEAIYLRLPARTPRPIVVAEDKVPDVVAVEADAYERMEAGDRARTLQQAMRKIDDLIQDMDAEDRLILQMRFWDARRVPDIARALNLDQKKLYKRLDRLFLLLRRELESAGLSQSDVASLMVAGDEEIHLHVLPVAEIVSIGPSHDRGGDDKVRGGEGRP
ncbi:MAG TPA: sigma-70 family RNA polymerase sigma factor [Thermoanaerobaculia bacterium]|nr:sigma-70 family RNA polymerase sigma factor [Thermoanaerobaculia bacterium]